MTNNTLKRAAELMRSDAESMREMHATGGDDQSKWLTDKQVNERMALAERLGLMACAEPVAWVRFRSDGGHEGPIMDSDSRMDGSRRSSGAWDQLYIHPRIPRDVLMALASDVMDKVKLSASHQYNRYACEDVVVFDNFDLSAIVDRYAPQAAAQKGCA